MADKFTPNDDLIRNAYLYVYMEPDEPPSVLRERKDEWERWQAAHDAKVREEFVDLLVEQADLAHFVGADAMIYAVPIFTVESIAAGKEEA